MMELSALALPGISLLIAVVGWWVVNRQHDKRERRKEERALVDGLKKLVIEVSKSATDYMCAPHRDEGIESDLKLALDQIEIELARFRAYASDGELVTAMGNFADAATGDDFESHTKKAVSRSDAGPQRLALRRNQLLSLLETRFSLKYH